RRSDDGPTSRHGASKDAGDVVGEEAEDYLVSRMLRRGFELQQREGRARVRPEDDLLKFAIVDRVGDAKTSLYREHGLIEVGAPVEVGNDKFCEAEVTGSHRGYLSFSGLASASVHDRATAGAIRSNRQRV